MRPRKNKKRIDPRYFLNETTDIDNDGDTDLEDVEAVVNAAVGTKRAGRYGSLLSSEDVEAVVNAAVGGEGGSYKAPRDFGRKPVPHHQGTSTHMRNAPTPEERQQDLAQIQTSFDEAALQVKSINIEDVESMEAARATLERIGRMIYNIQGHLDQSTYYQDDLDFAREPSPYGDE